MQTFNTTNGLQVIYLPRKSDIVTIQIMVKVGSNYETKNISGISHFIEHMVFEGTKTRSSEEIANTIESLGGEFSAYTTHEHTAYYIKIEKKHITTALTILSDIMTNPLFDKKLIEKERNIILSEIQMVQDQPRHYQWVLLYKNLFTEFPAKNPIYGTKEAVSSITRKDFIEFFKTYYTAPNMITTVVGDIPKLKEKMQKHFNKIPNHYVQNEFKQELENKHKVVREKRNIQQNYAVMGYKTPSRDHPDTYVLDVIKAVLGRGLSGTLFREIRQKHGLAYDVGAYHDANPHYGTFCIYFSTKKTKTQEAVQLALKECQKLTKISDKALKEAKTYIEGDHIVDKENSQKLAADVAEWALTSKPEDALTYIQKIRKVTKADVKRVAEKYFTKNYTLAIVG